VHLKWFVFVAAFAFISISAPCAQDFAGDWQNTLKDPGYARPELRVMVHIEKSDSGAWSVSLLRIDLSPKVIPASFLTLPDSRVKFTFDAIHGTYEGKVSADGNSISGTWTQQRAWPLELQRVTKETAWTKDPSPHTVNFISVDKDVQLEVLDWAGSGRPIVLLAGLGGTAHVFDKFAIKLNTKYHVFGITRRGFGASSAPAPEKANYVSDRLGDDVLAVIEALKLKGPVLVGHSLAGEELSSVGSRHAEKVAGLIYLDAAYQYAYWSRSRGELPMPPGAEHPTDPRQAIFAGQQKYTDIKVRALAIYAAPHDRGPNFMKDDPAGRAKAEAADLAIVGALADAFEKGVPSARVVRLPHANHNVFQSNEADVLREMNAFIASLP
jgi:pimeloyl-ACP methyl ester carboxylesterase